MRNTLKKLTSLLVTAGLSLGLVASTATPAHAASQITGCFRPASGGGGFYLDPVQLQAWDAAKQGWVNIATGYLNGNSCISWTVGPAYQGFYLRISMDITKQGLRWYGTSGTHATPGVGPVGVGMATVYCPRCPR